jgi:hypothetical protein
VPGYTLEDEFVQNISDFLIGLLSKNHEARSTRFRSLNILKNRVIADPAEVDRIAFREAVFNESDLRGLIARCFGDTESEPNRDLGSAESRLIKLDVIDSALYKTLVAHPELLRTLDWRVFEHLMADMLEKLGYEIELQRGTKDGGVDLFAIKHYDTFGPQRFLLQAKQWNNKVGVEPIRQLAFLHDHHRMTKSCLATTATFTSGAWQLGTEYRWQLELKDYRGICDWLSTVTNKASF